MPSITRSRSNNAEKFVNLNPALTEIKTFVSESQGMIDLHVNPAMDVAISKDKSTIYRLTKDRKDIRAIVPNNNICMDFRINGVYTKCSRNTLIAHLFDEVSPYANAKPEATQKAKLPRTPRVQYNFEDFDPADTYVEKSFGFNLVKNKNISVYFDMDNHTFYNSKNQIVSSTRGLKSGVYVAFQEKGKLVRKTMLQDHVVAMMYGYQIPPQSMVKLVDESKPLTKENIRVVDKALHLKEIHKDVPKKKHSMVKSKQEQQRSIVASYVTEDFKTFTNQDDALNHQIKVEKAKDVAQLLLSSDKVGYDLAEQAYLKIMEINRSDVSYKNFVDVVKNNNGILEVKKEAIKIDLNVNIDTLVLESSKKEAAQVLVCEIKDRINKLRLL